MIVLVVGATGSIGTHVVDQAVAAGHIVRALVRDPSRAHLPAAVAIVVGDVTKPETLVAAVQGVDAVVFTHGSDGGGAVGARAVDYGAIRNLLAALDHPVRIALMTAIGVTNRESVLQQDDRVARLEAAGGAVGACKRPRVHDRATGMVRLPRG